MAGNISSQFVSALLFVAPLASEGAKIRLSTPLESRAYVAMTLQCLKEFGIEVECSSDFREFVAFRQAYRPARYVVEGDWSSASYFLALGATCGEVEVTNLNIESRQGDKILLDRLRDMGAQVVVKENSVAVGKSRLRAIRADLSECIDLLPTLAVLAAVAEGKSEFTGVGRARLKESDRVAAVKEGLKRMGIAVGEGENRLTVTGSRPEGAVIDSRGDHRIAMAFSVLGTVVGQTVIEDAGCVAKTFPRFWDILKSIGGKVEFDGK
ncbi:MAG: 3-phosphoshikimate 1-carboxyvinyltransferase [Chloroflexota bacterium]